MDSQIKRGNCHKTASVLSPPYRHGASKQSQTQLYHEVLAVGLPELLCTKGPSILDVLQGYTTMGIDFYLDKGNMIKPEIGSACITACLGLE